VALQSALHCSGRLADPAGQARSHLYLGRAFNRLGQAGAARSHLTQAVAVSHALGDRAAEARAHLAFSVLWGSESDLAESLSSGLRALRLAEADNDLALLAKACNNVGYDYAVQGDAEQALGYCLRALDLCHQADTDPSLEAYIEDSLGYIYHRLGDGCQATASYWRAVRTFRAIGAPYLSARSLSDLGDCHEAAGDGDAAIDAWQQALAVLDELAHPDADKVRRKINVQRAARNAQLNGASATP
jgi:tetratricopeptide (TPR) repeat protein